MLSLALGFILLAGLALAVGPTARDGRWELSRDAIWLLGFLCAWCIAAFSLHRTLNQLRPTRDPFLLPAAMLLTGWGTLVVWRLLPAFGARQTIWLLVASLCLNLILRSPQDLEWLRRYRYLWLTVGILLLLLTLFFGTNPSGGDPRLWLGCCGVYLQPSEPLRILLIVFLASYFADRMAYDWVGGQRAWLATLGPLILMWAISTALLIVQRDLGTGTLFLSLLAVLLYLASLRWEFAAILLVLAAAGAGLGTVLFDLVRVRFQAWINPWADPIGGSYQIVQSLIALASGGILGRGPYLGSPGFVPAVHTDFIYTAIVEEWGLAGGIAMLGMLAVIVLRGLRIAAQQQRPFGRMLAAGISIAFGLQTIMILGGILRLLPLTGITLPFVSYGGSSLTTSFIALGLLLTLSDEESATEPWTPALRQIQAALLAGFAAVALATGWWTIVRAPDLVARTDNPRRAVAERYAKRGEILDRNGRALAESIGQIGSYQRSYTTADFTHVVGYNLPQYGQAGIEAGMDSYLHGDAGRDPWVIAKSYLLRGVPPEGLDVRLTLDLDLQQLAVQSLEDQQGAIILLNARSGELLALASSPTFDPMQFEQEWSTLLNNEQAPLLNRATQALYQPGLSIAPMLLSWQMNQGLLALQDPVGDAALTIDIDDRQIGCAMDPMGSTVADLTIALRFGCPGPIASRIEAGQTGQLQDAMSAFGFDQAINLQIPVAEPVIAEIIQSSQAVKLAAVGQGELTLTPLHLARAFSALAWKGDMPVLQLVGAVSNEEGEWIPWLSLDQSENVISESTAQRMMAAAQPLEGGVRGFTSSAASGAESGNLAWFLGAHTESGTPLVAVVLLEQTHPTNAQALGTTLLNAAIEIISP